MSYEDFDKKCDEIRQRNEVFLEEFAEDLTNSGLKDKTVNRHWQNVDFYINTFLLREMPYEMNEGVFNIDSFLGDFFIRKCMWSTPGTIKSTAASIKKFYKSMMERAHISELDYCILVETIRDDMDTWVQDCKKFNDPSAPNPFGFF